MTVIIGIAVDDPTVPADTPEFASLALAIEPANCALVMVPTSDDVG